MIITGVEAVVEALNTSKYNLVRPNTRLNICEEDWIDANIVAASWYENLGFGQNAVRTFGITPVTQNIPKMVVDDVTGDAIVLMDCHTQDKGLLPVWALEMRLFPGLAYKMFDRCYRMLEAHGMKIVKNGRPDCVVSTQLPFSDVLDLCNSRVDKSWKRGKQIGLSTYRVDFDYFWTMLNQGNTYRQLVSETMAHHASTQYPSHVANAELFGTDFVQAFGACIQNCDARIMGNPEFRFFETADSQDNVLSLAITWLDELTGELHWLTSYSLRSGPAAQVRTRTNLLYASLANLLKLCCESSDVKALNLGISTFDYKHDFNPTQVWYSGLEYV